MALLDEVSDWESIFVRITGCETLVGHIEERIVSPSLDSLTNLLPLFNSGVNASGVVRACMEQKDAALWCSFDV